MTKRIALIAGGLILGAMLSCSPPVSTPEPAGDGVGAGLIEMPSTRPAPVVEGTMPAPDPTAAGDSRVFSEDFESGTWLAWYANSGLVFQNNVVHSGNLAVQGTTSDGATYGKIMLPAQYADGYARIYFNLLSHSSRVGLLRFRTVGGASIAYLYIDDEGQLGLHNDVAAKSIDSRTTVEPGWHALEFHALINGAASQTEVWLDGDPEEALSGTAELGNNPIEQLQIGEVQSGRTYDLVLDDIAFDTGRIDSQE
jgi:hypothetical protein